MNNNSFNLKAIKKYNQCVEFQMCKCIRMLFSFLCLRSELDELQVYKFGPEILHKFGLEIPHKFGPEIPHKFGPEIPHKIKHKF